MDDGSTTHLNGSEIAIIGMACRFPGAVSVRRFWENLTRGVESLTLLSDEELERAGIDSALARHPGYVRAVPTIDGIEMFDAGFFGYTRLEAEVMDPQHRLFLEAVWQALEDAGYDPGAYPWPVGVFTGAKTNTYLLHLVSDRERLRTLDTLQIALGNDLACMATRVSYKLNLRGPSYALHTACSTSLVSVHLAVQSLLIDECRMAVAGGAAVNVPQSKGYLYQPGGILSPDGSCRTFDARAQGSNFGNGVGVVVLKRLEDALADGDHVYAVIKGSAANNDGAAKASYTAPGVDGQTAVILEALACAGVDADTISYIEAHGTATDLGDSIEMLALTEAFRASTDRKGFCAIGSVKTNIGHLETAAGIAGLIKTALALETKTIPASLHFEEPNPKIDFANSPFYVNDRTVEWTAQGDLPRRAGLSSFGIGSTNVHMILEEAPPLEPTGASRPWQLLLLSARSETALEEATANLAGHLREETGLVLADAAYTLQVGRRAFPHRRAVLCRDGEDAVRVLESRDPERVLTHRAEDGARSVVFLFPGLGDHQPDMALGLYRTEPTFREHVDRCCEILLPHLGLDLREILLPGRSRPEEEQTAAPAGLDLRRMLGRGNAAADDPAAGRFRQTAYSQPAVFVIEYALAKLWMEWSVVPQALVGYSLGEYVAACVAGVLSLEDALAVVARRAALIQGLPAGSMLAVPLSEEEVRPLLAGDLSLAAVNGPRQCVVAGPVEAVEALERRLGEEGTACRRLPTTHAFHSSMMDPIVDDVAAVFAGVALRAPEIPYISNVTGTWVTPEEATDPAFWARHLREAVRFGEGVETLFAQPGRVFLEVGPGQTLGSLAKLHPACGDEAARFVLGSLPPAFSRQPDTAALLTALGKLWLAGAHVEWAGFHARERRRRVPLPTYPFERQRYWIDGAEALPQTAPDPRLEKKADLAEWFYRPVWRPAGAPAADPSVPGGSWLVLCDEGGMGDLLAERLEREGRTALRVRIGDGYRKLGDGAWEVRPGAREDYDALLKDLRARGRGPGGIVHLWAFGDLPEDLDPALDRCFYSLMALAQALGRTGATDPLRLAVITSGRERAASGDAPCPEKATILGPAKVIPQEYPHIVCRLIDVAAGEAAPDADLAARLAVEILGEDPGEAVALRGNERFLAGYEPVRLEAPPEGTGRLREGGVYLITGGLGGVGLVLAEHLAKTLRPKLVLTRRTPVSDERTREKVRRLEELGAEVLVLAADSADAEAMRAVVAAARERFGALHGVLHAAGVGGGGLIQLKTREAAAGVLAPKVQGTRVLESVTRDLDLDLLVLFSSLQTALGDFGQIDYCAANAYLDALAERNAAAGGPFTIAIGWDNWQEVGIAVNAEVPEHLRAWREGILTKGILPAEGTEVFDRALAADIPRLVVTTQDLDARIEESHSYSGDTVMQQLGGPAPAPAVLGSTHVPARGELERRVTEIWQRMLGRERVGVHDNFFDLGGNSLLGMQLITEINRDLGAQVSPVALFEAPTISALVKYLSPEEEAPARESRRRRSRPERQDIAVVAVAGRFPGAGGIERFWQNLREGVDAVTVFSDEDLLAAGVDPETLADPTYVRARPVLDDVELFDATLFGYSPREAEIMDPQHRLFLQCAWEALERAGCDPSRHDGAIGVFAGAAISTYLLNLYSNPELIGTVGNFQAMIGNEKDSLATRVSYKLNLKGPSLSIQTFCSTSLVAVHLACQSLLSGECDMALAGGVSVHVPQTSGYHYQEGGFVSRDGRVKAFDAKADGFLFGNGLGVVVLKPLEEALADGDPVLAVIKGSAINNDGSDKVGYTATSVEGQSEVVVKALEAAGLEADGIGYIETHGTGTALGDPVEIAALTRAFRSERRGAVPIGSVKTNIGHLDRAAGVTSLIKSVLVLQNGEIPPSLHFEEPNPKIDFAGSPFYVNTRLTPWPSGDGGPRRIGINSLGLGGTNAHVILEEAPPREPSPPPSRPLQLLVLSAASRPALEALTDRMAGHLRGTGMDAAQLADAAWTLQAGRRALDHRRIVVCSGPADAATALEARDPKRVLTGSLEEGDRPVVFLFPGLGGQHVGMAAGLYTSEPVFREEFDRCADLLRPLLDADLREVIWPEGPREAEKGATGGMDLRRMLSRGDAAGDEASRRLNRTAFTQPALFAVEYALACLWLSWGVRPEALVGYSIGEYVAACLAGVLSLEDALTLVARRARLIEELPDGAMLAVPLPEAEVKPLLGEDLSLSAVNGPEQSVVSGPVAAVEDLERRLEAQGVSCRRLQVSHAFHSRMLEPLAAPLTELVGTFTLHPPRIPYLSNVTGTWIRPEEATSPDYWARHMVQAVRFSEAVSELLRQPQRVLLEVGPGQTLCSLVLQHPETDLAAGPVVLASMRHSYEREGDLSFLLNAVGKLWLAHGRVDWRAFHAGETRHRVLLPTYPFERQRYWVEATGGPTHAALGRRVAAGTALKDPGLRLAAPSWKRSVPPPAPTAGELAERRRWLVLLDGAGVGERIAGRLTAAGHAVTSIPAGAEAADLEALPAPDAVLDLRGLAPVAVEDGPAAEAAAAESFHALLALAQSLAGRSEKRVEICAVLAGTQEVTGQEPLQPSRAAALAACLLLPRQVPGIACRVIDAEPPAGDRATDRLAERILAEVWRASSAEVVAFRGGHRWIPALEPVDAAPQAEALPEGGAWLLAGPLEGPGLTLARSLACRRARVAVLGRCAADLQADLERRGAEVWVEETDLADPAGARAAVERARERFGALTGVVFPALPGETGEPAAVRRLHVLDEALAGHEPGLALVVSPLAPASSGIAAALVCETFAAARRREGIAWMAAAWDVRQDAPAEEGARALAALVRLGDVPQAVVASRVPSTRWEALAWTETDGADRAEGSSLTHYSRPNLPVEYVAPRNPAEETIAAIWGELLGVGEVGIHDDFLDLGGDSLLATRLVARMRQAFSLELPVRLIFEASTVAELAQAVEERRAQQEDSELQELLALLDGLSEEEVEMEIARRRELTGVEA